MYRRQLIAIEEMVVMIPAAVLHQPTVIMMEDGQKITRKLVLPTTMISQMPYRQRRPRTVPETTSAAAPATVAVCLVLIGFNGRLPGECGKVTAVLGLRNMVYEIRRLHSKPRPAPRKGGVLSVMIP
jgi:hypothetical protein